MEGEGAGNEQTFSSSKVSLIGCERWRRMTMMMITARDGDIFFFLNASINSIFLNYARS